MRKSKIDVNDIVHQYSGRLYIDSFDHTKTIVDKHGYKRTYFYYKCICTCKNKTVKFVERNHLIGKHIKSCGCLHSETSRENAKIATAAITSHNMSRTRFYKIWAAIKIRCNHDNCEAYPNYGGRGITYDPKWEQFEGFYEDMYEDYCKHVEEYGESNTSIDRKDNNGNYCKENCQWATNEEQNRNKRDTIIINYNNTNYPCSELYNLLNINPNLSEDVFRQRIKAGYSIEDAINRPLGKIINKKYLYREKEYSINELRYLFCDKNITYNNLYNRLNQQGSYSNCIKDNIITDSRIFRDEKARANLRKPLRIIDSNKEE